MSSPAEAGRRIVIDVPADLSTLSAIRAAVCAAAAGWGFARLADLELVTSELVTNAVMHTGAPSVLVCHALGASGVVVAVTDQGDDEPAPREPYDGLTRGRGLGIVDAVATSWGTFASGRDEDEPVHGKTVWARLGR